MIRLRPDGLTPYRLVFMTIFMVIGALGLSVFYSGTGTGGWLYAWLDPSGRDHEALMIATGIGGFISLSFGVMLTFLVFERRSGPADRRRRPSAIAFGERRSGEDRRVTEQPRTNSETPTTPLPRHPRTV